MLGRTTLLAIVAAALVAGCDGDRPTGTPVVACPADLVTGTLEELGEPDEMGIAEGPTHSIIQWVGGYTNRTVDGRLSVVSPDGYVVARVGDAVQLTGGHIRPGEILACWPPQVLHRG